MNRITNKQISTSAVKRSSISGIEEDIPEICASLLLLVVVVQYIHPSYVIMVSENKCI